MEKKSEAWGWLEWLELDPDMFFNETGLICLAAMLLLIGFIWAASRLWEKLSIS